LPWICLLAFLRLVTSARLIERPIAAAEACARVNTWLSNDIVWIPQPTQSHAEVLTRLMAGMGATGNLVNDAHLAALAVEHDLTIYSADSDFARFTGVRWINPLAVS
jgi:toxin-antitoxin system PIN domain toxin